MELIFFSHNFANDNIPIFSSQKAADKLFFIGQIAYITKEQFFDYIDICCIMWFNEAKGADGHVFGN